MTSFVHITLGTQKSDTGLLWFYCFLFISASTPVDLFLISSSEYSIQLLNIEAVKSMEEVSIFSGPMARLCSSVDFYPPKRYVFWASNMEGKIFRGKLVSDSKYSLTPFNNKMFNMLRVSYCCILKWRWLRKQLLN